MKKSALIALLAAVLIITGCGKREPEVTKIGAVLPLSGDISEYGKRCRDGIDLAVQEINASGGVKGKQISIVYEDDKGIPRDGVSALQKLISIDKTQVVIGAVASSVSLAMVPVVEQNKVVLFSPASSSPKLSGSSRFFFRNWPSDVLEAGAMALFAYDSLRLRKVAILWVNNDYGLGLMSEFRRNFEAREGKIVSSQSYPQNGVEFKSQLTKFKRVEPDAIYLAGYHKEMGQATKQIRELGIKAQILGDADYGVEELLGIAGGAAEGAIYGTPAYDPADKDTAVQGFAQRFDTKYSRQPSVFEANAYDAVRIIATVMDSGVVTGEQIAARLKALKDYPGAAGRTTFDENNDVHRPTKIKVVRGGKFVEYQKLNRR